MEKLNTSEQWSDFVKAYPKELSSMEDLQKRLGYGFNNQSLLFEAMTHRSSIVDNNLRRNKVGRSTLDKIRWNERIEFLGDSILGLVISSRLWKNPAGSDEGKLSKLRAGLVSEKTLAGIARKLNLDTCVVLGKGEEKSGGRSRDALLADALEALFGAVYLDGGIEQASKVINKLYEPLFKQGLEQHLLSDYKTRLQEVTQDRFKMTPTYVVTDESGPDHSKDFTVECRLGEKVIGIGTGHSKKKSSQNAAYAAFEKIVKGSN